jgi:uncharacterized membrane protein YkvA (DUF1232 family)
MLDNLKKRAGNIKQNVFILSLAYRDPRVPWYAKVFALLVVAYAFSPIDLIPDFIPVLGYLDDVIIVPVGIAMAMKMIPGSVLADYQDKAEEIRRNGKPKNWIAGISFIIIWILLAIWLVKLLYSMFK